MDITKPAIQIFYGKYLDAITNEIPSDHIDPKKNGPFSITLEPGKPNFPTRDGASITLENLDAEGNKLYPKQWFIDNSKSEGEGAIYPFELFFRIYVFGEVAFTGIYGEKKYSKNNDTVTITLNSIVGLLEKKDRAMVEFTFNDVTIESTNSSTDFGFTSGKDLNNIDLDTQIISIFLLETPVESLVIDESVDIINDIELLKHLGYDYNDFTNFGTPTGTFIQGDVDIANNELGTFSAYVKIGDSTILTRCSILGRQYATALDDGTDPPFSYFYRFYLKVVHADNSNYEIDSDNVILQRGRFFKDLKGTDYSKGDKVDLTIWSPDRGNNPEVFLKAEDIFIPTSIIVSPPPEYIHGVRWSVDGSDYQIEDSELNKDYFDVFKLTLDSISAFYSNFYETPENADFFDITNAGSTGRKAFVADAIMFGWIGDKNTVKDLIVSMARQTNSYLFADAMGKVVYQSRSLHHADYETETTPAAAIDLDSGDYAFDSGETEDYGFDTFEIKVPVDIVEINNLVSTVEATRFISESGVETKAGLRNTSLELSNYRIFNLAIPEARYEDYFGLWRKSPESASFPDYTADLMDEFIQTPVELATNYAKGFTWPTEFLYPKLPGQHYVDVTEGGLVYRDLDGVRTIYLFTKISRSTELFKSVEIKKEAEWEVG